MMILSRVCARFHNARGETLLTVTPAMRNIFTDAPETIREDPLFNLLVADGSMEVVRLFWWQHNCKDGQYSSAKVHRSVHVTAKSTAALPSCAEDYEITLDELPGLVPEIIDGI